MNMIVDIIVSFALQIGFTIGMLVIFGFLISICNKIFYKNFGNYGRAVCYITGAVGTPIHECSHALFCVIFGHKINEIKLFQISDEEGTLGYVNYSYNPKNIYHKIGNFFIGIAPIVVISLILYGMSWLLLPDFIRVAERNIQIVDVVSDFSRIMSGLLDTLLFFFRCASSWQWWVFVVIGSLLALHMNLSKADIKGAIGGGIFLITLILLIDIILCLIDNKMLDAMTKGVLEIASYLLCMFILATIISVLLVAISFGFKVSKKKIFSK